mmetsp:Transcript_23244/g.83041  ORF Transcript_23244/g.83041 Transcript_23244/m.83041 type:complete len:216 (-) Transcript_23244:443-1090(-)
MRLAAAASSTTSRTAPAPWAASRGASAAPSSTRWSARGRRSSAWRSSTATTAGSSSRSITSSPTVPRCASSCRRSPMLMPVPNSPRRRRGSKSRATCARRGPATRPFAAPSSTTRGAPRSLAVRGAPSTQSSSAAGPRQHRRRRRRRRAPAAASWHRCRRWRARLRAARSARWPTLPLQSPAAPTPQSGGLFLGSTASPSRRASRRARATSSGPC